MRNRLQLSLIVDDDTLWNELIVPYKQSRGDLNALIIKLMKSYLYDNEIRNIIDGEDFEEQGQDIQEILDNIKNTMAVQSFMADELQSSMENASTDISDIIQKANTFSEQHPVNKTSGIDTENGAGSVANVNNGSSTPLLSAMPSSSSSQKSVNPSQDVASNLAMETKLQVLTDLVKELLIASGRTEEAEKCDAIMSGQNVVSAQTDTKNSMYEPTDERLSDETPSNFISEAEKEPEPVISNNVVEEQANVEPELEVPVVEIPITQPAVEVQETVEQPATEDTSSLQVGNAVDSILGLLNSLK